MNTSHGIRLLGNMVWRWLDIDKIHMWQMNMVSGSLYVMVMVIQHERLIHLKTGSCHDANFVVTGGTSDDKVGIMTTLGFQWRYCTSPKLCRWFLLCCVLLWYNNAWFDPYTGEFYWHRSILQVSAPAMQHFYTNHNHQTVETINYIPRNKPKKYVSYSNVFLEGNVCKNVACQNGLICSTLNVVKAGHSSEWWMWGPIVCQVLQIGWCPWQYICPPIDFQSHW